MHIAKLHQLLRDSECTEICFESPENSKRGDTKCEDAAKRFGIGFSQKVSESTKIIAC